MFNREIRQAKTDNIYDAKGVIGYLIRANSIDDLDASTFPPYQEMYQKLKHILANRVSEHSLGLREGELANFAAIVEAGKIKFKKKTEIEVK